MERTMSQVFGLYISFSIFAKTVKLSRIIRIFIPSHIRRKKSPECKI